MIQYLINHLRLKNRIVVGFMLAGLIAFVIIAISHITFSKIAGNVNHLVEINNQSHIDFLLSKNISDIQRQALIYTYEGHQSAAEQVQLIYQELLSQIELSQKKSDENIQAHLSTTKKHLNAYLQTFEQVVEQRELQRDLLNVKFRGIASETEKLIWDIKNDSTLTTNLPDAFFFDLMTTFLSIEKSAFRYFDTLDTQYLTQAEQSFKMVNQHINRFDKEIGSLINSNLLNNLDSNIHAYETVLFEAVQRTRGYLYLVNVVMAAEAYEIIYQSKQLTKILLAQQKVIESSILTKIANTIDSLLIIGIVLFVLILYFSYVIGRSITNPIEKLTNTFRLLSEGSHETPIPSYALNDELGQLTHAAKVFREKNIETKNLLNHSKALTLELQNNKLELERSNDELEQFVYTVSHDLKSPLVTSMGFISIIKKLAEKEKYPEAISKLDKVVTSNQRMSQLINDLLELSRVGRIDLDKSWIDLAELVDKFVDSQKNRLEQANFSVTVISTLPTIYVNESRILQVFENLLSNALKYATSGKGSMIEIGYSEDTQIHRIYFKDNGPGISEEFHDKIFGLFYRLDSQQEGTGIGLAVAKKVMKFHGGDILIESKPGDGATFWLEFPKTTQEKTEI